MKNIVIPVITHSHHHGGSGTPLGLLITLLVTLYIFYFIVVCMERRFGYINRKQFITYLLIPYSMWIVWFIKLFKKDENE